MNNGVIFEIRAGTGGEEAALFVADLFLMYAKYAPKKGWRAEIIDSSRTAMGGFKEIIFKIQGEALFEKFKHEAGVHRVQRVPKTEKSGRIHTSTASVAVLKIVPELALKINPSELKIETQRAQGAGGQNVNKVETAVRITHLPTNITVYSQQERSQARNKEKAMEILRARIYEKKMQERKNAEDLARKEQIGGAARPEKIRTYNFAQNRLTDHRLNKSWYDLEKILGGNLDKIISSFK